jgi:hypothetical protein
MPRHVWPFPSAVWMRLRGTPSFRAILAVGCWFAFSSSKACRLNSGVSRRHWPMPPALMALVPLEVSVKPRLAHSVPIRPTSSTAASKKIDSLYD